MAYNSSVIQAIRGDIDLIKSINDQVVIRLAQLDQPDCAEIDEVIMPPLSAPDPKTREIEAANRAIEFQHQKKKRAQLKDLEDRVRKARAAAVGHPSPFPPKKRLRP
jgi:hypothetical protein